MSPRTVTIGSGIAGIAITMLSLALLPNPAEKAIGVIVGILVGLVFNLMAGNARRR